MFRSRNRFLAIVLALVLSLSLLVVACQPGTTPEGETPGTTTPGTTTPGTTTPDDETTTPGTTTPGTTTPDDETTTPGTTTPDDETTTPGTTTPGTEGAPSITFEAQDIPEEHSVTVAEVNIDQPGWIVIHGSTEDGQADESVILGQMYIEAGSQTDVSVPLNEDAAVIADETICAMLHYDNPADQQFTFPDNSADDPPVQADGEVVVQCAAIGRVAPVSMSTEITYDSADNSVTVPQIVIDRASWVVVYAADEQDVVSATILGMQYIEPGTSDNVKVMLESPVADGDHICVRVHFDNPNDQQFTFPDNSAQDSPAVMAAVDADLPVKCIVVGETPTTGAQPGAQPGQPSVSGQSMQDNTMLIAQVSIDQPGWIVIHGATADGQADESVILGQTYIPAGDSTDIEVTLNADAQVEPGDTLCAMLHYDEPNDQQFTFPDNSSEDPPVQSDNGDVVVECAEVSQVGAQALAPIAYNADDNSITVDEVNIDQPGWIVLYGATADGQPDESAILGQVYIEAGQSTNVCVPLNADAQVASGDTICAVLNYDDPNDQQFTYADTSSEDMPVEVNGESVAQCATVE